ncbi:MAG: hypothetical protein FWC16_09540 [Defluviitaleaceae bacterium]|nr:hypothetical protein [Defluviitaleaceae bacterium]MCL2275155.1 hypothetical protein [Defluviitaleaceae bacterium]
MIKNLTVLFFAILFLLYFTPITAFADGDPNIDGGGGGMGQGTATDFWNPGNDGVRVSIVHAETGATLGTPINYTNMTPANNVMHFGNVSKLQYTGGRSLSPIVGGFSFRNPSPALPRIISSGSRANIDAIRRYFTSEGAAMMIANDFDIPFERLVSGAYRLVIEPIAFFRFQGNNVAMTAHEAALYDQQLNGALRNRMTSLSHQNLPLALFLEHTDLGIPAFTGTATGTQSNATILRYLGVGIVSYTDAPVTVPPPPASFEREYRINTEVITAVTLSTVDEINPHASATVTFYVLGRTYTMSNIVIPEDSSQVVWFRWTTPPTEQNVTITISTCTGYLSDEQINARIVDLERNPPPDPRATDRHLNFSTVSPPNNAQRTSAQWTVWWALWIPYWEWEYDWQWVEDISWVSNDQWVSNMQWVEDEDSEDGGSYEDFGSYECAGFYHDFGQWYDFGEWVDNGWFEFFTNAYSASLTATSRITPDAKVPTAVGNTMKSGYGVNNVVTTSFSTNAPSIHVTGAQTAVSYFPEFHYTTYWRLLELMEGGFSTRMEFQHNPFSTFNRRSHFTPVWFPDGSYIVYTWVLDAWTPGGMLSMNLTDHVTINGTLFDDWRVAPRN